MIAGGIWFVENMHRLLIASHPAETTNNPFTYAWSIELVTVSPQSHGPYYKAFEAMAVRSNKSAGKPREEKNRYFLLRRTWGRKGHPAP